MLRVDGLGRVKASVERVWRWSKNLALGFRKTDPSPTPVKWQNRYYSHNSIFIETKSV